MAPVAVVFGILLIALGLVGYFGTNRVSPTALIPAAFGVLLLLLGLLALKDRFRKHAMHAAAALGLLGFLGSVTGWLGLPAVISAGSLEGPQAPRVVAKSIMAFLCLVFVALCVSSFIAARRRRARAAAERKDEGI